MTLTLKNNNYCLLLFSATKIARRLATFVKILNQEDISLHQNHDTMQEVGITYQSCFYPIYFIKQLACRFGCKKKSVYVYEFLMAQAQNVLFSPGSLRVKSILFSICTCFLLYFLSRNTATCKKCSLWGGCARGFAKSVTVHC